MKKPDKSDWIIKTTAEEVAVYACDVILQCAQKAIHERGIFKIVLAGGTTPKQVYALLTKTPCNGASCNFKHWHIYLGDERCLPTDDPERNSQMVQQVFLDKLNKATIPKENIHFIAAELGAKQAAVDYENTIKNALPFDMVLLGMGEDGHTASLFPGQQHKPEELVHAVFDAPKPPPERVSLSVKALSQNKSLLILVTGSSKQVAILKWRNGDKLPVEQIGSLDQVKILLDSDAARNLTQ